MFEAFVGVVLLFLLLLFVDLIMSIPAWVWVSIIVGLGIFVGAILYYVSWVEEKEDKERLKAAEERRKRERERVLSERDFQKKNKVQEMHVKCELAATKYILLSGLASAVNEQVRKTENTFLEGAYSPFWDDIELSIKKLKSYRREINGIGSMARDVKMLSVATGERSPLFPVSVGDLKLHWEVYSKLTLKMQKLVRSAQRDHQFSTIYEMRRTNKTLEIGFSSLNDAVNNLSLQIEEGFNLIASEIRSLSWSIDELSAAMHNLSADLNSQIDDMGEVLEIEGQRRKLLVGEYGKALISKVDEASRSLSNLERGIKPFPY